MIFNLEDIQKMWEEDSKIDIDNLHTESLNTSSLHSKYFEIYNNITLLKKQAEQQKKNVRHERYEYYTGKSDPEVYIENPFPKKLRDKDALQKYMDADERLSKITLKVEYYDVMLKYIEDIIKMIHNRGYQIKNSIEYMRFQSGLG
jgi:hypothetical protein